MEANTQKIVLTSMLAALCCVATIVIRIPSPLKGYINLGDSIVLLAGWMLPAGYAFLAAGIGSALADVFAGYVVYVPVTFAIKGLMAVVVYFCYQRLSLRLNKIKARIVGGILAEIIMVLGYYLFESCLYGMMASVVNIPANAIQGLAGLLIGLQLIKFWRL